MKYTKKNRKKVDAWLSDAYFQSIVQKDCGIPTKIIVEWSSGEILFRGPNGSKSLQIKDIVAAYDRHMAKYGTE